MSTKKSQLSPNERILEGVIKDIYWMARRYADGRKTYAPAMYNDAINRAIGCGIDFEPRGVEGKEPLYATDGYQQGATHDHRGTDDGTKEPF